MVNLAISGGTVRCPLSAMGAMALGIFGGNVQGGRESLLALITMVTPMLGKRRLPFEQSMIMDPLFQG